jgi:hypothetical protein
VSSGLRLHAGRRAESVSAWPGLDSLQFGSQEIYAAGVGWLVVNRALLSCRPSLPWSAGGGCQTWSGQVSEQAIIQHQLLHAAGAAADRRISHTPCERTAPWHPPASPCLTPDLLPLLRLAAILQSPLPAVGFGDLFDVLGEDAGRLCPLMSYCKRPEAHEILVPDGHFVQHVSVC